MLKIFSRSFWGWELKCKMGLGRRYNANNSSTSFGWIKTMLKKEAFLLLAVSQHGRVMPFQFSPDNTILIIFSCSKTESLLRVHNSGISWVAPASEINTTTEIDPTCWSESSGTSDVLLVTGQMRAVLAGKKWGDTAERSVLILALS